MMELIKERINAQDADRKALHRKKDAVQNPGGNLVRVMAAADGFHAKHGAWPDELHLPAEALESLEFHLTPLGMRLLHSRLRLVVTGGWPLRLHGAEDRTFDYEAEEDQRWLWRPGGDVRAAHWLGFEPF